jgi:Fe-Mn family superoxide dismutase
MGTKKKPGEGTAARYTLPDLSYDYGALEPHISGEIMQLHHDKHHRAYVEGANAAIDKLAEARRSDDLTHVAALERELAFHVSGHVLHSMFWQNLSPEGGGEPNGALSVAILTDFGSFDAMKAQLVKTAATIMGSGWGAIVWDPVAQRLATAQIHDHQSEVTQGGVPILVLDAWEHAYYLQYKTDKAKYFEAVWNLWNWRDVEARFSLVQKVDLGLVAAANGAPIVAH